MLIAAGAMAADFFLWRLEDGRLQRVVDAGALSAGRALGEGRTNISDLKKIVEAEAAVMNYGTAQGVTFSVNLEGLDTVNVDGFKPTQTYFSKIFGSTMPQMRAEASVGIGLDGTPLCVLALEDQPVEKFGVRVHNDGYIIAPQCRVHSNSSQVTPNPAIEEGSIYIRNGEITTASTCAVGGVTLSPNGWTKALPEPHAGCPKADDPLGHVPNPKPSEYGVCLPDPKLLGWWPGFKQIPAGNYCDGLTITNGVEARLKGGTFFIGGTGLTVGGGAKLEGVEGNQTTAIIVYAGDVTLDNGSDLIISAHKTGKYAGIALWRTHDTPCTKPVSLAGGVDFKFDGALYFPNCHVEISNAAEVLTIEDFTLIVGRSVQVWGGAKVTINANKPYGQPICVPAGAGGVGLKRRKSSA
jgi:hypothetical protein